MSSEQTPELLNITPLTFHVDLHPLGPERNPDSNLPQDLSERTFHHRFTATRDEPVKYAEHPENSNFAAYRRRLFSTRATFVPTFGSEVKQALYIQTTYVRKNLPILLANVFHTLYLVEFAKPNIFPAEIHIPTRRYYNSQPI